MGRNLNPPDLELYQRTDEVLHYLWDPIGIAAVPMARDEYQAYLPQDFGLLKENATEETITAYLESAVVDRMGLNSNHEESVHVASVLLQWNKVIAEKHSTSRREQQ